MIFCLKTFLYSLVDSYNATGIISVTLPELTHRNVMPETLGYLSRISHVLNKNMSVTAILVSFSDRFHKPLLSEEVIFIGGNRTERKHCNPLANIGNRDVTGTRGGGVAFIMVMC